MPVRKWHSSEWLGRIMGGSAIGCIALFVADLVICVPFPMSKGDVRWKWVEFAAEVGLPASFFLGALAGLAWRWSREVRLTFAQFIVYALIVVLIALQSQPVIARIRRPGAPPPLYAIVPGAMTILFGSTALAGAIWLGMWHGIRWLRSHPRGVDANSGADEARERRQS